MTDTRRDFLKFVVAGSVAAGCPVNLSLLHAESGPKPQLDGDHFAFCHEIRDGQQFDKPPVSSRHDVVIVGGGISGLRAAYFLRGRDFLLLEKKPTGAATPTCRNIRAKRSPPAPLSMKKIPPASNLRAKSA